MFAPAGLPPAIAQKLNADLNKVMAMPQVRAGLPQSAQDPVGGTQASFSSVVLGDIEKFGQLKKQLDAK